MHLGTEIMRLSITKYREETFLQIIKLKERSPGFVETEGMIWSTDCFVSLHANEAYFKVLLRKHFYPSSVPATANLVF